MQTPDLSPHQRPNPISSLIVLSLLVVLLIGGVLRLIPLPTLQSSDEFNYAAIAWYLSEDRPVINTYAGPPHKIQESIGPRVFALRFGITVPASWVFRVTPPVGVAVVIYPLLMSISEILLAFLLGRKLFNNAVGLLAAAGVALMPIAIEQSRMLLPDLPAAILMGWAILILLYAFERRTIFPAVALGVLAGLLLGASWFTKETIVFMAPFIAGLTIYHVLFKSHSIALAAGLAVVFVLAGVLFAESAMYHRATGDWMFRVHETERNLIQCKENFFFKDSPEYGWTDDTYASVLLKRLFVYNPMEVFFNPRHLAVEFFALVALIYVIVRHVPRIWIPAAWLLIIAVLFTWGSTSLSTYRPHVVGGRDIYVLVLPAMLLIAAAVWDIGRRMRNIQNRKLKPIARVAFVAAIMAWVAASIGVRQVLLDLRGANSTIVDDAVAQVPQDARIITDYRRQWIASYYLTGTFDKSPRIMTLEEAELNPPKSGDYVLFDETAIAKMSRYDYQPPPRIMHDLQNWPTVWSKGSLELLRVP